MHSYLISCYEKIVLPMSLQLKKIMIVFQLANEGELFASNLQYRLCFNSENDKKIYTGDPGSKNEDAIQNLNTMKRQIKSKFTQVFREIVLAGAENSDSDSEINAAVALYLATYFDTNPSCTDYWKEHGQNDTHFVDFFRLWNEHSHKSQAANQSDEAIQYLNKIRSHPDHYHNECVEAEQGNKKKMRKLLMSKKLFCIPWLLAGDVLLVNYPDKYDTAEYKEHIRQMQFNQNTAGNSHGKQNV